MSDVPLTCPFCGQNPQVTYPLVNGRETKRGRGLRRAIRCMNEQCPARPSVTAENLSSAVAFWNTRSDDINGE